MTQGGSGGLSGTNVIPLRPEGSAGLPRGAVKAKLPFPLYQGWITAGAPLTSNQGLSLKRSRPSLLGIRFYRVWGVYL